jgi:DNA-binding HxlR family transcriptional regulator
MVAKIEHKTRTGCPVACSLDILGDHWTLLIIRNLMFLGLHEYKDMLKTEEKISSSILSDRLKKLEHDGIISSTSHPDSGRRKLYYLTEKGKGLVRVMIEIARWADHNLGKWVHIPDDKRPFVDCPVEYVVKMVLQQLDEWEKENLQHNSILQ